MAASSRLKSLEKEINDELMKMGLPSYFKINRFDAKTGALEHTIGYHRMVSSDERMKTHEVIRKHCEEFFKVAYSKE